MLGQSWSRMSEETSNQESSGTSYKVTQLKSFCYIPIVSSVTLWERGSPNTSKKRRFFFSQKPQQQKQQTECCFSLLHESFQPSSLHCRGYALGPASSRHHRLFCNDFVTGNQRLKLQPIPRCKTTASPCSRFLTHMETFSSSHKTDKLHFLPFPGSIGTHSPMTGKRLLCVHQYTIPKSPASTISLDEEIGGEARPSLSSSSEMEEDDLLFTINEEQKPPRRLPNQTWISPFLEMQAASKLLKKSHSVNTISLEAAGRHIPLQNHPLVNSKGDSAYLHSSVTPDELRDHSLPGTHSGHTRLRLRQPTILSVIPVSPDLSLIVA